MEINFKTNNNYSKEQITKLMFPRQTNQNNLIPLNNANISFDENNQQQDDFLNDIAKQIDIFTNNNYEHSNVDYDENMNRHFKKQNTPHNRQDLFKDNKKNEHNNSNFNNINCLLSKKNNSYNTGMMNRNLQSYINMNTSTVINNQTSQCSRDMQLSYQKNRENSSPDNTPSKYSKKYMKDIDNYICHTTHTIGKGSFGKVVYGTTQSGEDICFKFEKISNHKNNSILKEEYRIYNYLDGGEGIPKIFQFGQHKSNRYLIMELIGPSLDKFFNLCEKKFNLETTLFLGQQMVDRIEFVHSRGFIHRDIKPNNFLFGKFSRTMDLNDTTLYIIDFGLSAPYLEQITSSGSTSFYNTSGLDTDCSSFFNKYSTRDSMDNYKNAAMNMRDGKKQGGKICFLSLLRN